MERSLPDSYRFAVGMPLLTNSWKNHAWWRKCVRYSRKFVPFNWQSSPFIDDAAPVASVNFAKLFRTLASFSQSLLQLHSRLLFSQRPPDSAAFSQFPSIGQSEAKSPIKEKDLFFPPFWRGRRDGNDLLFEQYDKSQGRKVTSVDYWPRRFYCRLYYRCEMQRWSGALNQEGRQLDLRIIQTRRISIAISFFVFPQGLSTAHRDGALPCARSSRKRFVS